MKYVKLFEQFKLEEALTVLDMYDDIAKEADTVLSGNRTFKSSVKVVNGKLDLMKLSKALKSFRDGKIVKLADWR